MANVQIPRAPPLKSPTIPVFTLINGSEVQRMEYTVLLLNSYTHLSVSHEQAVSKMVSVVCSCIPEMEKYLSQNTTNINFHPLSYSDLVEVIATGKAPEKEDSDDWAFSSVDPSCLAITNPVAICASAAVSWMTYAKAAGESSRTAMEQARPKMMKGKYKLRDDDTLLFPGETLGPALESLEQVNLGFSLFPNIRHMMTAFFISLKTSSVFLPPNADPFMMIFDLLKNVGMTHVGAVIKFVEMCPWALKVPELAADFSVFASDLTKMALIPQDIRPYHRLLVPQTDYLFITSTLRPLVAVAGNFVKEVDRTFRDYVYNETTYLDLIERVRQRAPLNSTIPDVASLEEIFGVQAQEPREKPQKITMQTTVT
jgi:hypothetical protein